MVNKKNFDCLFYSEQTTDRFVFIFDDGDVCTVKSSVTQLQLNTIYLKGK